MRDMNASSALEQRWLDEPSVGPLRLLTPADHCFLERADDHIYTVQYGTHSDDQGPEGTLFQKKKNKEIKY